MVYVMMKNQLAKAISILRSGGVIAHATDTCYGFACDIGNKDAVSRLYDIKKMALSKPVSIMVCDLKMAEKYGYFSTQALKLAKKYWPGALTIIVKRKKDLPIWLNPKVKTIGIRIPNHKLTMQIINKFDSALTTTSANISGKPSPYSVSAIKKQFSLMRHKPDFIVNSGASKRILASTVIDISGERPIVIRQGGVRVGE